MLDRAIEESTTDDLGGLKTGMVDESPMARQVHGFKSKLTAVAALSDVISKAQNLTPEQVGRLRMIGDSARFVAEGLADLSLNSDSDALEMPGIRSVDVCELTAQAVRHCRPLFDRKRQKLNVNYCRRSVARVDYEPLLESVRILLANASDHTEEGSHSNLSVGVDGQNVYIEIVDNGPGFDPANTRVAGDYGSNGAAHPTIKFQGRSRGGLSFVRDTADSHDGEFTVESVLGSGSRVTLRVPDGS